MSSAHLKDGWLILPAQWHALSHPLRDIFINISLLVHGMLDVERMKSSLLLLVKQWRILAARLRRNKGRNIDILIPQFLNEHDEWFSFVIEHREEEEVSERVWHNCSSKLQQESWIIEDQTVPKSLPSYFKSGKNRPTMYVRLKQFKNTAVIQVSIPHLLYDILGISMILSQWCELMTDTKDVAVIPKLLLEPVQKVNIPSYPTKDTGGRERLKEVTKSMSSPLRTWSKAQQVRSIANAIPEFIAHPKEKIYSIFVPISFIAKIREASLQNDSVWISENDVVTALLFQLNLFRFPDRSRLPFTLAFTLNMRGFMPGYPSMKDEAKQVWLGNSNLPAILPTYSVTEWRSKSIVEIACLIRSTILTQRQPEQMKLTCMMARESAKRATYAAYHPPNHKSFYCTSWEAAKFSNLCFCATDQITKSKSSSSSVYRPGQVIRVSGTSIPPNTPHRTWSVIVDRQQQWCTNESNKELYCIEGFWSTVGAREGLWRRMNAWLAKTLWS